MAIALKWLHLGLRFSAMVAGYFVLVLVALAIIVAAIGAVLHQTMVLL